MTAGNGSWYQSTTGSVWVVGEVRNGLNRPVELVQVTADFYSASGRMLASETGFADIWTMPAGSDSPFSVLLLSPPAGISRVEVRVTDYFDPPFLQPVYGLSVTVTNTYFDIIGVYHIVGTVRNNSTTTWTFVEPLIALYGADGRVVRTDFTFTKPSTLAPGESGTFDAFVFDAEGVPFTSYRVWVDANWP